MFQLIIIFIVSGDNEMEMAGIGYHLKNQLGRLWLYIKRGEHWPWQ